MDAVDTNTPWTHLRMNGVQEVISRRIRMVSAPRHFYIKKTHFGVIIFHNPGYLFSL